MLGSTGEADEVRNIRRRGQKSSTGVAILFAESDSQWIGHPKAGPRLANLFTLIENCRQVGVDVAAYLTDLITRLPGHPAGKIAELLPAAWKRARDAAKSSADPPAA